jgi:hypothetical protein
MHMFDNVIGIIAIVVSMRFAHIAIVLLRKYAHITFVLLPSSITMYVAPALG